MKKLLSLVLCIVLCFSFSACGSDGGSATDSTSTNTTTDSTVFLMEQDNVKISFTGISEDIGIGEGISLLVENSRDESIIVNIAEASLNDVMHPVMQPQMPLHLTSPGKKSIQTFVFSNAKIKGGKTQFKIKVMNENYEELFVSDYLEISL